MNKSYKSILNRSTGTYVAASENVKSAGKSAKSKLAMKVASASLAFGASVALLSPMDASADDSVPTSGYLADVPDAASGSADSNALLADNAQGSSASTEATPQTQSGGKTLGAQQGLLGGSQQLLGATQGIDITPYIAMSAVDHTAYGAAGYADAAATVSSVSNGQNSIVIGGGSVAGGGGDTVIGVQAVASSQNATAIGFQSNAAVSGNAIGYRATAGTNGAALGNESSAAGLGSTALGYVTKATGTYSIAAGWYANASASQAVALGANSVADRANTVSVGNSGSQRQVVNVAAGTQATDAVNYGQLMAAGLKTDTNGAATNSFVAYDDSTASTITLNPAGTKITNVAAGDVSSAASTDAVNGGQLYTTNQSVAANAAAIAANTGDIAQNMSNISTINTQVGTLNTQMADAVKYDSAAHNTLTLSGTAGTKLSNVAAGTLSATSMDAVNGSQLNTTNQNVSNLQKHIAFNESSTGTLNGRNSTDASVAGDQSVVVGGGTLTQSQAVAVGTLAQAGLYGVSLGYKAVSALSASTAVGYAASATGSNSSALGAFTSATGGSSTTLGANSTATGGMSTALSANSTATGNQSVAIGYNSLADVANTVSVGNASLKRKVVNVAAGATTTDAVNYGQLMAAGLKTDTNGAATNSFVAYDDNTASTITLNPAGTKITNVAAGDISSAASTDAVNGGQLYTTNQSVAANAAAIAANTGDIATNAAAIAVNTSGIAQNTSDIATNTSDIAEHTTAIAANTADIAVNTSGIAQNTSDISTINTQVGTLNTQMADAVKYDSAAHDTLTLSGASGTKITNVAAGTLSSSSTDAVNGAQLYATNTNVSNLAATVSSLSAGGAQDSRIAFGTRSGDLIAGQDSSHPAAANGADSVAIGGGALASDSGTAVGALAGAGFSAAAFGYAAQASGDFAEAFGRETLASGSSAIAVGMQSTASGSAAVALGNKTTASATGAVALGSRSVADQANTVSVGSDQLQRRIVNVAAGTDGTDAVNLSQMQAYAVTASQMQAALKNNTSPYLKAGGLGDGSDNATIGTWAGDNIAIGSKATADTGYLGAENPQNGQGAIAIGSNAKATGGASQVGYQIALGDNTVASNRGAMALGGNASATGNYGVSIGMAAQSTADYAMAMGFKANASGTSSVALGANSVATQANTVSVGSGSLKRQIVNVAAGGVSASSTDALNGSQLYANAASTASALGGGSSVNADGTISAPAYSVSGTTVNSVGAAISNIDGRVTTNTSDIAQNTSDISTLNTQVGTLNGQMADVAKYDTSAHDTMTLSGVSGTKITNVAAGDISSTDSTDAVNGSQLYATNQNVAANTTAIASNTADIAANTSGIAQNTSDISAINTQVGTINTQLADAVKYDSAAHDTMTLSGASGTKITNVAAGDISSADSTDAVNGSQLYATNQNVAANATAIAANTSDIAANTADIAANTSGIAQNTSDISAINTQVGTINTQLADAVKYDSAAHDTMTLSGASGTKITNVAAGDISSADSTDAVNGSQLYATNQNVAANTTAIAANTSDIAANTADITANTSAIAQNTSDIAEHTTAIAANTADIAANTSGIAQNTSDISAINTQVGTINTQLADAVKYDSAAHDTMTLSGASGTKITNVAAGDISSADSTDAVNGSQLYATNQNVAANTTAIAANTDDIASNTSAISVNTSAIAANTSDIAANTAEIAANTSGIAQNTSDISAINTQVDTINTQLADAVKYDSAAHDTMTLSGASGTKITNVAAGDISSADSTDAVNGSQLYATNQNVAANTTAIAANTDDIASNTSAISANTSAIAANTSDIAAHATAIAANTADITANTSAIAQNTSDIAEHATAIAANTADIAANTNGIAQNTSDISAINTQVGTINTQLADTVKYDSTTHDTMTLSGASGTKITNVAAGDISSADSTDAVNGSQLYATNQNVAANATAIAANSDDIANNTSAIAQNTSDIAEHATAIAANTADITANTSAIAQNTSDIAEHTTAIAANTADIAANTGGIAQNTSDISAINTQVGTINTQLADAVKYDSAAHDTMTLSGASGTKITNVAAGDISSADSTDAVNGSQLYATNQNVADNATAIAANTSDIARNTADIATNTSGIAQNTADIGTLNTQMADAVKYDAGSDHASLTLGGAAGTVIKNVAAGQVSADSTEAINGSQLFSVQQSVGEQGAILADAVRYDSSSHDKITLGDPTAGPVALTNVKAGDVSETSTDAVNGSQLYTVTQDVVKNTADIASLNTSMNDLSNGTAGLVRQDPVTQALSIGANTNGDMISFAGLQGARVLTGVANGMVSSASQDAVNGSQLFNTSTSVAAALGGGASVDANGGVTAPSYTVGGKQVNDVGSAVSNLDGRITQNTTDIAGLKGDLADVSKTAANAVAYDSADHSKVTLGGTDASAGVKLTNVADGDLSTTSTDAVNGSQLNATNARVSATESAIEQFQASGVSGSTATGEGAAAIGSNADASGTNSTAAGANSIASGDQSTATGANATASGSNATAAGANSMASGDAAVAFGGNAAASGSSSAAIGGNAQASGNSSVAFGGNSSATADNSVALGANSVADEANTVSVGSAGNERRVTNVAPGVNGTDATNVNQLNALRNDVNSSMTTLRRAALGGVAAAMAMPNLMPSSPGKTVVGAGVANYKGYNAFAAGATYRSENNHWLVNGAVSVTQNGDAGVRAQAGYEF